MREVLRRYVLPIALTLLPMGLAACSQSTGSGNSGTTSVKPSSVSYESFPSRDRVERSVSEAMTRTANISFSMSITNVTAVAGSTTIPFPLLTIHAAGPFDLAKQYGALELAISGTGSGAGSPSLLNGPAKALFAAGSLYVLPNSGSVLAGMLGGRKYGLLTPSAVAGLTGLQPQQAASLVSNPVDFLHVLSTPDMTVSSEGHSSVGGGSTEYRATVNLYQAGTTPSVPRALFAALESWGIAAVVVHVWVDGSGYAVRLSSVIDTEARGSIPARTITLRVSLSNFGTTVPPVAVPPASQYATL